jgi:hypothetical protein
VKTDNLITRLLKSELSDASKAKLGRLINILNSDTENSRYAQLIDAINKDKTIQSVFEDAEITRQINAQQQYAGYMDTSGVINKFSISGRTLNEWCKNKVLPCYDFRGKNYFLVKDVEDLFLKNYTGTLTNTSANRLKNK